MELKEYIKENGLVHSWFAQRVGLRPTTLSAFFRGRISLPVKYWTKIIVETKGQVSYEELAKSKDEWEEKKNVTKRANENVRPQKQCVCSSKSQNYRQLSPK